MVFLKAASKPASFAVMGSVPPARERADPSFMVTEPMLLLECQTYPLTRVELTTLCCLKDRFESLSQIGTGKIALLDTIAFRSATIRFCR
jgi:hypothetical protein